MNLTARRFSTLLAALLAALLPLADFSSAQAAQIIYESGTLGPTGVPWSDLTSKTVPGTNINDGVYVGVRFHLNQPAMTAQVGGHFTAPSSGTFFGAIVRLANENDFPDSSALSTPDVLGAASLTFPSPSAEVFGDLTLALDPGWYALVFGSGLFGTNGFGGALRNNVDIGDPSYIGFGPNFGWLNLDRLPISFDNHRFVVKGQIVPEPSSIALTLLPIAFARAARKR